MALSQVQIYNLALTKMGQDRAVSPSDDVEAVRALNSLWEFTRDSVLAAHPWKFAIKRAELPALAEQPLGDWAYQYTVPEECLRLVQVGYDYTFYSTEFETFALEGGRILTDEYAPLFVRYVQRVTNTGLWPVLFGRVVAMQLALDACEKLTTSSSKTEMIGAELQAAVKIARRQSAIERPPQQPQSAGGWIAARGD